MVSFRASVTALMGDAAAAPALIPVAEPPIGPGLPAGRPTLRRGATGPLVQLVQRRLGISVDGEFGGKTEAAMRELQRAHGLVPDGIVGPKTWAVLDTIP